MDIRKEWLSTQHQAIGKQLKCDPLERNAIWKTARAWWMALETTKELENHLKELDRGVSRKRRHWATLFPDRGVSRKRRHWATLFPFPIFSSTLLFERGTLITSGIFSSNRPWFGLFISVGSISMNFSVQNFNNTAASKLMRAFRSSESMKGL